MMNNNLQPKTTNLSIMANSQRPKACGASGERVLCKNHVVVRKEEQTARTPTQQEQVVGYSLYEMNKDPPMPSHQKLLIDVIPTSRPYSHPISPDSFVLTTPKEIQARFVLREYSRNTMGDIISELPRTPSPTSNDQQYESSPMGLARREQSNLIEDITFADSYYESCCGSFIPLPGSNDDDCFDYMPATPSLRPRFRRMA